MPGVDDLDLPTGLTSRPLTMDDAYAVYDVMALQQQHDLGKVEIEPADIVGDWQKLSFDVENHPEITFVSTDVERDGDDWAITGDLTIKDVTKPITIDFEATGSAKDPFGNLRIGFEGKATLSRKDWGLTWNAALETGGMLVSDKIKLEFDISAIAK